MSHTLIAETEDHELIVLMNAIAPVCVNGIL
jgi:hypothetical protein